MRIVIDGFPVRVGSAGIGTYTMELLGALTRVAPEHEYYLADFGPKLTATRLHSRPRAGDYEAELGDLVSRIPLAWKAAPFALRQWLTRLQAARLGADIYFGTNFLGVFHPSFRTVITVHDMSHIHYPRDTYPFMRRKLVRRLPADANRADAILTVSESTKRDVVTHLRVSPAKVRVVYNGVSPLFRPVTEAVAREQCRRRYSLPERFLLHVGTLEPRKNVQRLLEAFRFLTGIPSFTHTLVIVGGSGWRDRTIRRALASFARPERLVLTGWVAREHLPVLYSMADALVYPTLYEGFGLPVLEAMACGTPVVTSNVSSLPEVAGDAALLVDPESVEEIVAAIRRLVEDSHFAESLRERGFRRARAFSWESAAGKALEVFGPRQALRGDRPCRP